MEQIETAGDFELEEDITSSGDESTSLDIEDKDNQSRAKHRCLEVPRWKKSTNFNEDLPSLSLSKVTDEDPALVTADPLELWCEIDPSSLLEHIVDESVPCASRDKNDANFALTQEELHRFLGILLSLVITPSSAKVITGQHSLTWVFPLLREQ